jgi:hypothetical protein
MALDSDNESQEGAAVSIESSRLGVHLGTSSQSLGEANPPLNQPSLLTILSPNQYPIVRGVFRYFNQYDLNSLRATCHTLRTELPTTSNLLGAACQSSFQFSNFSMFHVAKCDSPFSQIPLRRCPVYVHAGLGNLVHTSQKWSCHDCITYGVKAACKLPCLGPRHEHCADQAKCRQRYIEICKECFDAFTKQGKSISSDLMIASSWRSCFCDKASEKEMILRGYCHDCSKQFFETEVADKLANAILRWKTANEDKPPNTCAECKGVIPTSFWGDPANYYMCVECETAFWEWG